MAEIYKLMKSKKFSLVFTIVQILYVIIGQLQFQTIDWLIQWYSAVEILNGIPFYLQSTRYINGRAIWDANHLPLFFYALAVWMKLFGSSHFSARIFMYIWFLGTQIILIEIISPDTYNDGTMVLAFIALNPYSLLVTYLGLFDYMVMFFVLCSLYFLKQEKLVLSSIFLLLAIFTKTFPIILLAPFSIYLYKEMNLKLSVSYSSFILIITGIIYYWFFTLYGEIFLTKTFFFQFTRNNMNTSLIYLLFGFDIPENLYLFQLLLLILISSFLLLFGYNYENLFLICSYYIIVFIILLRTSYPHYTLWYSLLLVLPLYQFYRNKQYNYLTAIIGAIIFSFSGFLWCLLGCFDDPNASSTVVHIQILFFNLGHLLILIFIVRVLSKSKSVNKG